METKYKTKEDLEINQVLWEIDSDRIEGLAFL